MDFRYHVLKHLCFEHFGPLVNRDKKAILPLQFYTDIGVFLGYFTMSNTLSFQTFTGWGLEPMGLQWMERDKRSEKSKVCSTCAAAASALCLLLRACCCPRRQAAQHWWSPGSSGMLGMLSQGLATQTGRLAADWGRLAEGQKDEGQEHTSLPRLQQVPSLPHLVGVRLLQLSLLPPSSAQMTCQLNVML